MASSSPKPATKKAGRGGGGGGGIFDRLTDSSQYTGAHKQRFDGDGHGRGKAGRVDEVHDTGYVQGAHVNEQSTPSPKPASASPTARKPAAPASPASSSPKPKPKAKPQAGGGGGIFDRLTDSTQYTGAHKQRFDGDGHGRGKAGRVDTVHDTGYVQGAHISEHPQ